eukprot:jgi/Chlat1/4954/Chrsp32S04923
MPAAALGTAALPACAVLTRSKVVVEHRPQRRHDALSCARPARVPLVLASPARVRGCSGSRRLPTVCSVSGREVVDADVKKDLLVGEDAAVFSTEAQSGRAWLYFFGVLGTVTAATWFLWLEPQHGLGTPFIRSMESLANDNSEVAMLLILIVFAIAHSGLAGLRASGEKLIGARAYRVLFGVVSLPLAIAAVAFFINHRYDGVQLWSVRESAAIHAGVWIASFISFFFLYPSTFNLLEVAAVDKPKLHMWETGVMRITRHPQMFGQLIWCLAHTLWIGNSFMLTTSAGLLAHHVFGVWHGDRRVEAKYGDAFQAVKARTSIVPFAAILDGRQQLPKDYYKEFLRVPYLGIVIFSLGAYFVHPLMQLGSYKLHW